VPLVTDLAQQCEALVEQPARQLPLATAGSDETHVLEGLGEAPAISKLAKEAQALLPGVARRIQPGCVRLHVAEVVQSLRQTPAVVGGA